MPFYCMICASGTHWLTKHTSADAARRAWDREVERDNAEPAVHIRRMNLRDPEDKAHADYLRDQGQANPNAG